MDLEAELGRLYELPLDEFTDARNELARRLRRDGDREAAEHVRSLRKPSVAAWAINQLARRERTDVEALLGAVQRMRDAQRSGLTGDARQAFSAASDEQRAAIARLVAAARSLLGAEGRAASEATVDRVGETLRAASVDPDAGELLRAGRLATELEASGFGPLPDAPAPPAPTGDRSARADDEKRTAERRRAREAVRAARDEVRERRREVKQRERELERLERSVDDARKALERERARLDAAVERLDAAEQTF